MDRNQIGFPEITRSGSGNGTASDSVLEGRVNAAVKQLRELATSPDEIQDRARRYRKQYAGMALTPQALTGNWAALANGAKAAPVVRPAVGPYVCPLDRGCSNGWLTDEKGDAVRCECMTKAAAS